MDTEQITVRYPSLFELIGDLRAMGESNALVHRAPVLNRDVLLAAAAIYRTVYGNGDGAEGIPATFEVIHMIGWKSDRCVGGSLPRSTAAVVHVPCAYRTHRATHMHTCAHTHAHACGRA